MIKEIILKGIQNGGFTIDAQQKEIQKNNGFMVSIYGYEKTFNIDDLKALEKNIIQYLELIKNKKNVYVGLWVDNDIIYLDISKHYSTLKQAKKAGIDNEQLAIYDLKNNCSIDLTKNVYILYYVDKITNDLKYINESLNINDLKRYIKKDIKNMYDYITEDIENIKNLLNDRYIIVKDKIAISEL